LTAATWRQHGRGGRLLLVDCCLLMPLPSLLPPVSSLPPYLSLNSKMKNTVVKIVSYQYRSGGAHQKVPLKVVFMT
jgi:hypothetical protein